MGFLALQDALCRAVDNKGQQHQRVGWFSRIVQVYGMSIWHPVCIYCMYVWHPVHLVLLVCIVHPNS